ncbi:pro-neuregulin-2, membrane-bound isoform-like isoform X2 [Pleurodeles waltl]
MRLQYLPIAASLSPPLLSAGTVCFGGCGALLLLLGSSAAVAASMGGMAAAGGGTVTISSSFEPSATPRIPQMAASPPAALGRGLCYLSPSVVSVQELAERSRVVIEGRVQGFPVRPMSGNSDSTEERTTTDSNSDGKEDQTDTANGTAYTLSSLPPAARNGASPAAYLVKVHQVWAAKAGGLRRDSLLWVLGDFGSCLRLKEDSKYIFFIEPTNSSGHTGPGLFRASFPPLETGRNLKKEVSRVLCRGCENCLGCPSPHSLGF